MDHLIRQRDLVPMKILREPITVIGAGAIGSFTTLMLAKMGFTDLTVYDADVVSVENMSSQFFRFTDIEQPKVLALHELVHDFTGVEIRAENKRFTLDDSISGGLVISAVDSMTSRRVIFEAAKKSAARVMIDPRMGAEFAHLYVIDLLSDEPCRKYEKTLYADSEAVQEPCTAKATIYTANMLSGLLCKSVRDVLRGDGFRSVYQWSIAHDDLVSFE